MSNNTLEQDEMYRTIYYKYIQPMTTQKLVNQVVTNVTSATTDKKKEKKVASYMQQTQKTLDNELPLEEAIKMKKDISKMDNSYEPFKVESYWYKWWESQKFFRADEQKAKNLPDDKKYIMVVPPPNVTGYLHIGHGITAAIEDSLCRWKRMQGYVTEYLPGTDHAGIATQSVVEKQLWKNEQKTRHDFTREQFLEKVWEWKESHGNQILNQFKRLGVSMDWDRLVFTMDEKLSKAVKETFVRLYDRGLIYRANRLVNWSCKMKTALSDVEVEYLEIDKPTLMSVPNHDGKYEFGVLTKFAYKVKGTNEEIIVATTRLETMLGDVAVAVHPSDERYKHLHGKELEHPFFKDRKVIIVTDDILVDPTFGTGAVKITPGHDPNDYECGLRHNLPQINIFNDDGQINQNGGQFKGLMRYDARVKIFEELEKKELIRGKEPNKMRIGLCYRSKDIIEPLLRPQWYVNCQEISQKMIQIVKDKELRILPEEYEKNWFTWFENLKDWCISRQIWWGHRCPAYKILIKGEENLEENWVVGRDLEEATVNAEKKTGLNRSKFDLQQDEDVLDTWFSSALFPFSPFGWPDENCDDFKAFFPNTILETGHDILFFWVARMVMMSTFLIGKIPFRTVFLHPIIRDSQGRKMSKSLGNVVDPLEIIEGTSLEKLIQKILQGNLDKKEQNLAIEGKKKEYPDGIPECGSDALRYGLLAYMIQGRNINLDLKRIIGWRQFCNKIWQSFKFVMTKFQSDFVYDINSIKFEELNLFDQWILTKLNATIAAVNQSFEIFRFGEATSAFYSFWMYDFCDVYIEASKFVFIQNQPRQVHNCQTILFHILDSGLRLLHPMMPFLTEELYQKLPQFNGKSISVCIADYPQANEIWKSEQAEQDKETIYTIIRTIRQLQSSVNLPNSVKAESYLILTEQNEKIKKIVEEYNYIIIGLAKAKSLTFLENDESLPKGCIMNLPNSQMKVYLQIKDYVQIDQEVAKLEKKMGQLEKLIENQTKKMTIKDYESKTPKDIQEMNTKKLEEYQKEQVQLAKSIEDMKQLL